MSEVLSKITESFAIARGGIEQLQKAASILSSGPADFYLEKLQEYVNALFGKFAPFQVGDRVTLTKAPNTDNTWNACKHFLIPGAVGTVRAVDYQRDQFWADVEFDKETWIREGQERDVEHKHVFHFAEDFLTPLA